MEMPKPTEAHRKLEALVGEWAGDEILFPSPWAPEERRATGRTTARMGIDGFFLLTDYTESRDGEVMFRGHGVYGFDVRRQRYTMHWFDSMGMPPNETLGTWEGDTLTFTNQSEMGHARYSHAMPDADHYVFRIETSRDGATWQPMMEGRYTRA